MEILIAIGILALVVLIFFIIQTLISARASLQRLDSVLENLDVKLSKLTPLVNTMENISEVTEKETARLRDAYEARKLIARESSHGDELATWLISTIKLGLNFVGRR